MPCSKESFGGEHDVNKRNILKHDWHVLQNELKQRWPEFTEADLQYIYGDHAKLVEVVQKRRHMSQELASLDVDEFLKTLYKRANIA
jgi:hypothetical protein